MYILYIMERCLFFLLYTFKKAINCYKGKVALPKGALRFRGIFENRCASFIEFVFSSIVFI